MDVQRWRRVEAIFNAVVAQVGPERERILSGGAQGDAELRTEVESLLYAHEQGSSWVDVPAFDTAPRESALGATPNAVGERVGRYTLRSILGIGGMGVVWEAEQDHPKRTVAVKIIHSGLLAPGMVRRFELEADILARLQHSGIAQIYEAGTHASAAGTVAYFAMERVIGESITDYCANRKLNPPERLRLFMRVCEAVEHAHQKGVVHRDLKPGNILVDTSEQPKVLDFGLARTLNSDVQVTTVHTEVGQIMGTVPYMSPEQVGGRSEEIDTRSDVYSLGVVLYELISGRLPYDLTGKLLPEAARIIREIEPRRLGTLLPAMGGDLEIIVGKALEKDPARRYASVSQFASDIHRYLLNEPITARPASTLYQLRKLALRNKTASFLVAVLTLVILASAITTGWLAVRFAGERDSARESKAEESTARQSADQVAIFLERLFEQANPNMQKSPDPTVRELITTGVARLETELADQPLVRARLSTVLGEVYRNLADYPKSRALFESAIAIIRQERGDRHPDLLPIIPKLVATLNAMGAHDEAQAISEERLAICRHLYGENSEEVADAYEGLGSERHYAGDPQSAAQYHQRCLDIRRSLFGEESIPFAKALHNLGFAQHRLQEFEKAEQTLSQSLELKRRLGGEAGSIGLTCGALSQVALALGQFESAEAYARQQLTAFREGRHEHHPAVVQALNNLALIVMESQGAHAAEPLFREVLDIRRSTLGEAHTQVAVTLSHLADARLRQGDLISAAELHLEALEIRRDKYGSEHDLVADSARALAEIYWRSGQLIEAEDLLLESHAILERNYGPTDQRAISTLWSLTALYREQNRPEQTAHYLEVLGMTLVEQEKFDEALPLFEEALAIRRQLNGNEDPLTLLVETKLEMARERRR